MTKLDRDLDNLDKDFRVKVDLFLKHCKRNNIKIFITEGYRTKKRQEELYAQGRTQPGNIVTRTLKSMHLQGKAIDIAFNGEELYPKDHKKRVEVGAIASLYEIDWGYELWERDKPHFQCNGVKLTHDGGLIKQQYLVIPEKPLDDKIVEYTQTSKDCSDYASIGALSDLYNRKLTPTDIWKLNNFLEGKGFKKERGDSVYKVSVAVAERWRIMFGKQGELPYPYLISLNSETANKLLAKKHSIVISRKTSTDVVRDRIDGIFSGIYSGLTKKHATRVRIENKNLIEVNNKKSVRTKNKSEYRNWAVHIKNGTIALHGIVFI